MKRQSLNHQFLIFLCVVILSSCSRNNFPAGDNNSAQSAVHTDEAGQAYFPPQVISVSDDLAKSNKDGELYYDNELGYRYWRNSDGKYYLDKKYANGASPVKNIVGKKQKKSRQKSTAEIKEEGYVVQ